MEEVEKTGTSGNGKEKEDVVVEGSFCVALLSIATAALSLLLHRNK